MFFNELEMLIRLMMAIFIGGLIGYERELRGRDAGIRTHAIVSLGATVMALIQLKSNEWVLNYTMENPEYVMALSSDVTRFIAQVVSGIGFLGAGTIIVSRRSVTGLTTAASLWAVAGLGISIGMGYYMLGLSGALLILVVLKGVKIIFQMDRDKNIEIHYEKDNDVSKFLDNIFKDNKIKVISEDYSISYIDKEKSLSRVKVVYELQIPDRVILKELFKEISKNHHVLKISTLK